MNTIRDIINAEIIRAPYTTNKRGDEVFPTLNETGWKFQAERPVTVPVVVTPDGIGIVGEADESGILWRAGTAFVLESGDTRQARENSISYTPGCRAGSVTTDRFSICRGFGQTPILAVEQPVLLAVPA